MCGIPSTGSGRSFYFSSRLNPLNFLPSSKHTTNIDKLAHIGEYAGLVALLHRAIREQRSPSAALRTGKEAGEQERVAQEKSAHNPKLTHALQHLWPSALIAFAYGLFDEIHQQLVPGRGFELADIGYDLIGIIAALGVIWVRGRGAE
jgi:VanZ family protein